MDYDKDRYGHEIWDNTPVEKPKVGPQFPNEKWLYTDKKKMQYGPITTEEMITIYDAGIINSKTPVIKEDGGQWKPLCKTELLKYIYEYNNYYKIFSNTFVIIGTILFTCMFISMLLFKVSLTFVAIFVLLSFLIDAIKLEKRGYKNQAWVLWILFFYPMYLYERAKHIDGKFIYAIIAFVAFLITYGYTLMYAANIILK